MNLANTMKPMTSKEAADYLSIPMSQLYKLTCSHSITFSKPKGGKMYFWKSDLDEYINKGRMEAIYRYPI